MSESSNDACYTAAYGDESLIAAFATTPGNSALTLIRCSGKGAIEAAASVFSEPEKIKQAAGYTLVHGWIVAANKEAPAVKGTDTNSKIIDEVLVSVFRAPKSYTGEDSLDISCHGGPAAGKAVMDTLKTAGFRDALPGEFTFRSFMNGKLDLTKAESVMELVSAKTDSARCNAVMRLFGALESEINEIKKLLVEVLSGAEIYLDYSEDEISAAPGDGFDSGISEEEIAGRLPKRELALTALARLKKLAASWQVQRIYQEGITAVIAGRPNAGKSSLFNLLLKEDRSIVTDTPGTTRDWIEAWVSIQGYPVRLIDTAGLRESNDPVEKIGVDRSLKLLEDAEIILYLIDGTEGVTKEDKSFIDKYATYSVPSLSGTLRKNGVSHLFVWNKADLVPSQSENFIGLSAKTGEGLAELYAAISRFFESSAIKGLAQDSSFNVAYNAAHNATQNAALGSQRQKNLIDASAAALEEALTLADKEEPLDIIAPLLREAVNALGEITGEVSTADILEEMFSKFCVGK